MGWLSLDLGIRLPVGMFITAWVARYLGLEQFGLLNYAISFVAMFAFFGSLGMNEVLIRDIVKEPDKRMEIIASAFLLKTCGAAFTFILVIILSALLNGGNTLTTWIVAITVASLFFQSLEVIDCYFQAQVQSQYAVLARVTACLSMTVVKIYMITHKMPLIAIAWTNLAEPAISALVLLCAYQVKKLSFSVLHSSVVRAKQLIKDSWPMFLSGIAGTIAGRIDQVLLHYFVGNKEVGIYAAAQKISDMWLLLGVIFIIPVFPLILTFKAVNEDLYWQKIYQAYRFLAVLGIGAFIVTVLFSGPIITVVYGKEYQNAAGVLAIYMLNPLVCLISGATAYVMVFEGLQRFQVYRAWAGCAISIILNFLLIQRFGAMGAAAGTVLAGALSIFIMGWRKEMRKVMPFFGNRQSI